MVSVWRREICSMGETELKVNIVADIHTGAGARAHTQTTMANRPNSKFKCPR